MSSIFLIVIIVHFLKSILWLKDDQKSPLEKRLSLVRKICKEIDKNKSNHQTDQSKLQLSKHSSRINSNHVDALNKSLYRSNSYSKALSIQRHILNNEIWSKYNGSHRNKNLQRYLISDNYNGKFSDFNKFDLKSNSTTNALFYQNLPRVKSLPQVNFIFLGLSIRY